MRRAVTSVLTSQINVGFIILGTIITAVLYNYTLYSAHFPVSKTNSA